MRFSKEQQSIFYKILESRRDVRSGFKPDSVPEDVILRILKAAHSAPSVGFMQPWNFIIVKDPEIKEHVKEAFLAARNEELQLIDSDRKELYSSLKLEGIEEAPVNILVTCQRDRDGETGLGRGVQDNMDLFSTVCAIQNLWLSARAENIGVGWVSILKKEDLINIFNLPEQVEPVAYLCLGYVEKFEETPDLERQGWNERYNLQDLIFLNKWGKHD